MATANLSAAPRSDVGKGAARKHRAASRIPAVVYGHHRDPQPLTVDTRELERLLSHIAAETTVIELSLDGQTLRTLIREVQRDPVRRSVLHVDFQELVAGEKVTVDLPIVLVGTPQGVRDGGILDQVMRQVTIEVDPAHMPDHAELDVSALGINESLHVSDLRLPEGVRVMDAMDATVCVVSPPRVEAEPVPAEAAAEAPAEPEVIRKAKTDEDEGEGEK